MSQYDLIIEMLNARFDRLEKKVDGLQYFKWKSIGFSAAIVCVFTAISFLLR